MAPRSRPYVRRTPGLTALSARSPPDRPIVATQIVDATDFVDEHPGDPYVLTAAAGTDATEAFDFVGHSTHAKEMLGRMARPDLEVLAAALAWHHPELHLSRRGAHPTHARSRTHWRARAPQVAPEARTLGRPDYTSLGSVSPPKARAVGMARRIFSWQW